MKRTIIYLFLSFFVLQFSNAQRAPFMRVYNSNGKKVGKGFLFDTTDTTLILSKGASGKNFIETPVTGIELIKTKRTTARRICNIGLTVVGGVVLLAAAIFNGNNHDERNYHRSSRNKEKTNSDPDKITNPPKPLNRYKVNSNLETWQKQRVFLNRLL